MTKTSVLSPEDEHDIDRAEWAAFVADGEALAGALELGAATPAIDPLWVKRLIRGRRGASKEGFVVALWWVRE